MLDEEHESLHVSESQGVPLQAWQRGEQCMPGEKALAVACGVA